MLEQSTSIDLQERRVSGRLRRRLQSDCKAWECADLVQSGMDRNQELICVAGDTCKPASNAGQSDTPASACRANYSELRGTVYLLHCVWLHWSDHRPSSPVAGVLSDSSSCAAAAEAKNIRVSGPWLHWQVDHQGPQSFVMCCYECGTWVTMLGDQREIRVLLGCNRQLFLGRGLQML